MLVSSVSKLLRLVKKYHSLLIKKVSLRLVHRFKTILAKGLHHCRFGIFCRLLLAVLVSGTKHSQLALLKCLIQIDGLIIAVVCSLTATNYTNAAGSISYGAALIGVAATVLLLKFKVSIPKVILLSAVLGLFLTR